MKNFIQHGKTVTLTAPYDRESGQGALVGSIFGVAAGDVLSGADGEFVLEGVFDLTTLEMLNAARGLRDGRDMAGNELKGATSMFLGATERGVCLCEFADLLALPNEVRVMEANIAAAMVDGTSEHVVSMAL